MIASSLTTIAHIAILRIAGKELGRFLGNLGKMNRQSIILAGLAVLTIMGAGASFLGSGSGGGGTTQRPQLPRDPGARILDVSGGYHGPLGDPVADARKAISDGHWTGLVPASRFHYFMPPGIACRSGEGPDRQIRRDVDLPGRGSPLTAEQRDALKYFVIYNQAVFGSAAYPDPDMCQPVAMCETERGGIAPCLVPYQVAFADRPREDDGTLQGAARLGDLELVKARLGRSGARDLDGLQRSLDYALQRGHLDVARFLLESGAKVYITRKMPFVDTQYYSAMDTAVWSGRMASMKLLVDMGMPWIPGQNAAEAAGSMGRMDIVEFLQNSYPDRASAIASEALIGALTTGNKAGVDGLIDKADLNYVWNGWLARRTALSAAWVWQDVHLARRLIEKGADPHFAFRQEDTYPASSLAYDVVHSGDEGWIRALVVPAGCPEGSLLQKRLVAARDFAARHTAAEIKIVRMNFSKDSEAAQLAHIASDKGVRAALLDAGCKADWLPEVRD